MRTIFTLLIRHFNGLIGAVRESKYFGSTKAGPFGNNQTNERAFQTWKGGQINSVETNQRKWQHGVPATSLYWQIIMYRHCQSAAIMRMRRKWNAGNKLIFPLRINAMCTEAPHGCILVGCSYRYTEIRQRICECQSNRSGISSSCFSSVCYSNLCLTTFNRCHTATNHGGAQAKANRSEIRDNRREQMERTQEVTTIRWPFPFARAPPFANLSK